MSSADGDETFLYRERGDVREFVKSVWRKALEERPELGGSLAHQSSFDHEVLSLCLCLWGFDFEEGRTHLKFREGGLACYLPAKLSVGLVDQLDGDDRETFLLRLLENSCSRILSRNPHFTT